MEIAITLAGSGFMSGLTALFAYYQTKNIKQAETKINIGGEQMKQLLKESDDHIKYIHKLNVISNEYILAYKEYNNIKPEQDKIFYRYILLDEAIDYDKYSDFNKEIDKTSVENLLSKLQIKGELYQEIENNYDENTLFFAYSICSLLSWLQIKKKNNNNLHASVMPKGENLQMSLDKFIDILNKDLKLSIPIHSQINLGESLIKYNFSDEGEIRYDIIDFSEFKEKMDKINLFTTINYDNIAHKKNEILSQISYKKEEIKEIEIKIEELRKEVEKKGGESDEIASLLRKKGMIEGDIEYMQRTKLNPLKDKINDRNIFHFKEYTENNQIIRTLGIVKMSEQHKQFEKENDWFINNFNKNILEPLNKMYKNITKIQNFLNSIEDRIDNNDIQKWIKILLSLFYITLFRYFSRDKNKIDAYQSEMRKNWKLFILELHKQHLFKSFDGRINLCDTNTHLDLLITKWEIFFKDELLKRDLDINEIKSTFYINNSEAKYLKKYIQKNAIDNLTSSDKDTYQFIERVNRCEITDEEKNSYFENGININNLKLQSKIQKFKNEISSDFEKKIIYSFKDIVQDFLIAIDDCQILDNLNLICNDISKYSEERILSDTKKRKDLLKL